MKEHTDYILQNPHYRVGDQVFRSKMMASIQSNNLKQKMTWHFHDDKWENLNIETYPDISLQDSYMMRARQLRDSYDYLILYYSGGIDSWTILHTFLKHNIRLDHIVVKFPFKFLEKKLHNPNTFDRSDNNRLSEWDFVVKKDLEWISKNHPSIKIELVDYLENPEKIIVTDDMFSEWHGQYSLGSILRGPNNQYTEVERKLSDKGKRVGCIYGIDKPRVAYINKKMYYFFLDAAVGPAPTRHNPSVVTEYFYWAHNNRSVLYSQLKIIFNYFKTNPHLLPMITPDNHWKSNTEGWRLYVALIRDLVYPDWDKNRFQCDKPSFGRQKFRPGDMIVESHPEVITLSEELLNFRKSYIEQANPDHLFSNGEFLPLNSNLYQFGEIL